MIIKKILRPFYHKLQYLYLRYIEENLYRFHQKKALKRLKDKTRYKCVFFALVDSVWKCDSVYQEMLNDPRFEPVILICPVVNYGQENMVRTMDKCSLFFKEKGYDFILAFNKESGEYIDVKKELSPDIIFYTNPYSGLIDDRYYIDKFKDILTCYIPYFYASGNSEMFYNLPFHHYVWRYYCENESLKIEYEEKQRRKLKNVVPTGYCVFDEFEKKKNKLNFNKVKKIIWAPHHMIEANPDVVLRNGFLHFYDIFFHLADKYAGKVEFVFRPHPVLKNKLYKHPDWGKNKTDEYYAKWRRYPYCSINEQGDYITAFYETDAIIHDCGSFITEYLYVNKPALFTDKTIFKKSQYWESAIEAIECYYRAECSQEIEEFIDKVVIGNNDKLEFKRTEYCKKYLYSEKMICNSIIENITRSIDQEIV